MTPGLKRIFATRGFSRRIALQIGITPSAVCKWARVPAERVLAVEEITGIPRGELRPDLYPAEKKRA